MVSVTFFNSANEGRSDLRISSPRFGCLAWNRNCYEPFFDSHPLYLPLDNRSYPLFPNPSFYFVSYDTSLSCCFSPRLGHLSRCPRPGPCSCQDPPSLQPDMAPAPVGCHLEDFPGWRRDFQQQKHLDIPPAIPSQSAIWWHKRTWGEYGHLPS